ncbi:protein Cep78 homolog [Bradysia coprophila]|uniref:protein Cep78 homolog n=1 Tax=Bradysia coprophila TaxID=38358 RepID=UPI00187DB3E2|nr:protein Cep78 homolog [Bradysia coprophila]
MSQSTLNVIKNLNNSFHNKYLTLCKRKNVLPNHEIIKNKLKLEVVAERMKIYEWQIVTKALEQDNSLQSIEIVSRRPVQCVREQIHTEKRCRDIAAKGDPLISTKYLFCPLVRSISNCVKDSTEIQSLALEGLPLTVEYIQSIANAILQNNSLKMLSFARSNLMDDGCVIVCSTIKHLSHIEKINFSYCDLTEISAAPIGNLIKYQTINRYSEEWIKSFRYQDVSDTLPGLKCLVLNGNEELGDKGLQRIIMELKDDEWMKAIEFQNCGLTDNGGSSIIDCLKCNKTLTVFDVGSNPKMSRRIFNEIQKMLGADPDTFEIDRKESTMKLREAIDVLEQRLEIETANREQANKMNIQLHNKLKKAKEIKNKEVDLPPGYLLINEEVLNAIHKQLDDLRRDKHNPKDGHDPFTTDIRVRMSEQSVCGDSYEMQNVQIHQGMSRTIQQEYGNHGDATAENRNHGDATAENHTESNNIADSTIISEDEANLFKVNMGQMKSVYTMLNEPIASDDGSVHSDQN